MFRKGTRWKHVLQAALTFNSFYVESTYPIKRIRFLKLTNLASVWGKRECSAFPRNSSVLMNAFKWLHGDMQVLVLYCLGPQNQVASATAKQCYTIPIHWPCHIGHQPPALIVFIAYTFSAVTYRNKNKKNKRDNPSHNFPSAVYRQKCSPPTDLSKIFCLLCRVPVLDLRRLCTQAEQRGSVASHRSGVVQSIAHLWKPAENTDLGNGKWMINIFQTFFMW